MKLPRGWISARIDELAGVGGLVTDGDWVESKDQDPNGRVRLTQLADVGPGEFRNRSARFMSTDAAQRLGCTYLRPGDVLIARMPDPIGRACVFPGLRQPAVTAVDVMIWRTDGDFAERDWFAKWINSPAVRTAMSEGAGGTTRQRISGGRIKEMILPVPPLPEQRRIVARLDALNARVARARAILNQTKQLVARLRVQSSTEMLNSVSFAPRVRIADICRVGTGATPKRGVARYYEAATIPWIMSGAVNDGVITKAREFISTAALRETNCKIYPAGSVIVALYGEGKTRGKVATLGIAAATNQALAVLHSFRGEAVDPGWVKLCLEARYETTREQSAGGVQPNLSLGIVKGIQLSLPDLLTQRKLLKLSRSLEFRADRLEAEITRARALLDRLEAAILARAFRGELVPQDPSDEPASVLLERIRARRAATPKPKRTRRAAGPG